MRSADLELKIHENHGPRIDTIVDTLISLFIVAVLFRVSGPDLFYSLPTKDRTKLLSKLKRIRPLNRGRRRR